VTRPGFAWAGFSIPRAPVNDPRLKSPLREEIGDKSPAPVAEPSLRTGITAEVAVLRDLLQGSAADVGKITEHKQGGN